ncbi:hypothetical protein KM043_001890 [Ampulex compressa]|nr:hypothetical protein KM043_001890 [Ampulex compressa]
MRKSSASTGKNKAKYDQWRHDVDDLTCKELTRSDTKQNEAQKSQPVKIAQLLGNSKSAVKDSKRKRAQPERLRVRAFTDIKGVHTEEGNNLCSFKPLERNVRRNLNFNNHIPDQQKDDTANRTICCKFTDGIDGQKNNKRVNRKSFLLPPNSIKDMHLRKSCRMRGYSKVDEESIKSSCSNKIAEVEKSTSNKIYQKPPKKCIKPYHSSKYFSSTENIKNLNLDQDRSAMPMGIGIVKKGDEVLKHSERDNFGDNNLMDAVTIHQKSVTTNSSCTSFATTTPCNSVVQPCRKFFSINDVTMKNVKNSPSSSQSHSQKYHSDTDLTRFSKDLSGISKDELFQQLRNIQEYIFNAEDNLSKLKLTVEYMTKLLSGCKLNKMDNQDDCFAKNNSEYIRHIKNEVTNECKKLYSDELSPKMIPSDVTLNREIQGNTDYKLMKSMRNDLDLLTLHDSTNIDIGSPNPCTNLIDGDTENKENCSTLILPLNNNDQPRSLKNTKVIARILQTPTIDNDSFLNLERECGTMDMLSPKIHRPVLQSTPAVSYLKDKGERPVQEYMRLKSNMNLLQTPDIKGFRSFQQGFSTKKQLFPNKTHISDTVLAELCNLYTESPKV